MATEAALATLDHVWGALAPLGHPMAVMGGISLAAWSHLLSWVARLDLTSDFAEIWQEAFPGMEMPRSGPD